MKIKARTKQKTHKIKKVKLPRNIPVAKATPVTEAKEIELVVATEPQASPKEQEKVQEPSLIKFSRGLGKYAGAGVGGIAGGKFGFAAQGAYYGAKYGSMLAEYGAKRLVQAVPILGQFKKGGRVNKTGAYILHKGEKVIPTTKARRK